MRLLTTRRQRQHPMLLLAVATRKNKARRLQLGRSAGAMVPDSEHITLTRFVLLRVAHDSANKQVLFTCPRHPGGYACLAVDTCRQNQQRDHGRPLSPCLFRSNQLFILSGLSIPPSTIQTRRMTWFPILSRTYFGIPAIHFRSLTHRTPVRICPPVTMLVSVLASSRCNLTQVGRSACSLWFSVPPLRKSKLDLRTYSS